MLAISYLLVLFKILPITSLNASVFVSCVTMSASVMMQTLSDSRGVASELRINRIQFVYLLAVAAFASVCSLVKSFTASITDSAFVSRYILLGAFVSAIAAPILSGLTAKLFYEKRFEKLFGKVKNKIKKAVFSRNDK